ncbi:FAD:protein FMN transferase [Nocardioides panaciterrulae]|uniref:FAD:protein FMN transferase n=1 Tax=Nocardioides panaciterrulae TaxID=661492 RepID=A0A7Y9E8P0_9ACTN|nr:FAD:protein FMN transferase [Nocardioides panaciterrulae]NYD43279.1 thiamine biosynthesis lipoprotein [Nocardioides panaciterrulae]
MAAATTFSALGCHVHVGVHDAADLGPARRLAEEVLRDVDEVCSRFRADSDLSRVNRQPGRRVGVHPLLLEAVEAALGAARATDGLVHPLLGRPLVQLGYDRDHARLTECPGAPVVPVTPPGPHAWREVRLDPDGAIRIPAGTALDLGATGKAWAADLVAAAFTAGLTGPAVVSVGGDLALATPTGRPVHPPWPVAVAERPGDPVQALVTLDHGGLATSSTQVRRWTRNGVRRHHLLDPRTGQPVAGVWRTVTATGATCVAANTASTAAVVLGEQAPDWLLGHGVDARLVAADGTVRTVGAWPQTPREEGTAA